MNEYEKQTGRFEFVHDAQMVIGSDGCSYDTEAEAFYNAQLGLCGCGNPDEVHAFLIECLKASNDEYPMLLDRKKIQALVSENAETVAEFILHFLDSKRLTQHGGSVLGSWLTERGKQFVEVGPME